MSADNWATCPRCIKQHQESIAVAERVVAESYGKVPVDEFDAKRAAVAEARAKHVVPSLREDYELGILEGGEFYVIYSGHCKECGLSYKFRHEAQVEL